ncbi:MAG: folate family ECF transporter S component [Thermoanaerobacteraceae bacterium]|nr:folate family ECF transporter S component [Thermoanaerobacteraceae bacterium]
MNQHALSAKSIAYAGLFIALSIVLTRTMSFMITVGGIQGVRIGLGGMPIILSGIVLGPGLGALVGAASDVIGYILFPNGPYFPGFTLTAALSGALPAILLRFIDRKRSFPLIKILIVIAISDIITSIFLDTYWLVIMYHKAIAVLLPPRITARVIMIPVNSYLIYSLLRYVPGLKTR